MTGYSKKEVALPEATIAIEIKSLNSKGLDLKIHLPQDYRADEITIRQLVTQQLNRGKVDVYISVDEQRDQQKKYQINTALAQEYQKELEKYAEQIHQGELNIAQTVLTFPNVLQQKANEKLDLQDSIKELLVESLRELDESRIREGNKLEEDILGRINIIQDLLKKVAQQAPNRTEYIKKSISKKLNEIDSEKIDQNRLEQEMIYYMERLDIGEEITRLGIHLNHFLEVVHETAEVKGKKLGFVSQEMGREINTIGSKANDAIIQKEVILMKDQLESIKEQLANIL